MRDTRIRVLLHPRLEPHEAKAALEAAEAFRGFGLKVESMAEPKENVWADLCRKRVYEVAFGSGPVTLYGDEPLGRPSYFARVPHDGAILAGLTPRRIYHEAGGRNTEIEGFNMYYVGAVVSSLNFRPSADGPYRHAGPASTEELSKAIVLGMMHELGHSLLGVEPVSSAFPATGKASTYDEFGHCKTDGCIMQDARDYISLLRSRAADRIGFCSGCSYLLEGRVTELKYYACA
ncbi:MAG TPA: hypothetical protein VLD37_00635 [Candidatus Bilamarchaeum sp.]|nr:hypothetical protein [Candidatus Bilamarchaeum sp.]